MRALILGGSRFIGRRLARELAAEGHDVTVVNRGRAPDGLGESVERLRADRRSRAELEAALGRREFDAAYDFLSYEASDAALAVTLLHGRVGRFVHVSTCSVYWCTGDFPCPVPEEDFERLSDFAERPGSIEYDYGYAKRKAEEALFAAHRERGFPVTIVRIPVVGGEEDRSLRYASYCLRASDGGAVILPDGGHAPLRHAYVGDVTRTLASIPSRPAAAGQAYNLAGHEILSVRLIVSAVAAVLGRRAETLDVPAAALRRMGLGTAFSPFSWQAPLVPAIHKARRDLGWEPTPYSVWLERAVSWAVDACRDAGLRPQAYDYRPRELEVASAWRGVISSIPPVEDGPASTSAARPE